MTQEQEFQEEFEELDVNGDGVISREEFLRQLEFVAGGGVKEDVEHYRKAVEVLMKEFDNYDLNGDGQISREEYFSYRTEMSAVSDDYRDFIGYDVNASGFLALEELPAPPELSPGTAHSPEAELYLRQLALLKQYDFDGDGRVRLDEFLAARKRARAELREEARAST